MKNGTQFTVYLQTEQKFYFRKAGELARENRKDEAKMAKIRANVFGIFANVIQTAESEFPENELSFVREQIEKIPGAWQESLSAAELHNDYVKVMNERIKLDAIIEIKKNFLRIVEGSNNDS